MKARICAVEAGEEARERLESIRQSLKMIEVELQKFDARNGFSYDDARTLRTLDAELHSAFEFIVEAGY